MSTETSHSAAFLVVPAAGLLAAGAVVGAAAGLLALGVVASAEWVNSRLIAAFAIPSAMPVGLDASAAVEWARRRRATLAKSPAMAAVARVAPETLARARLSLDEAAQAAAAGDAPRAIRLARRADSLQRAAARAALSQARTGERHVVAQVAQSALSELGYSPRIHHGARLTGIFAVRGDTVMAVLVHDGGSFETDVAGLGGDACRPVMAEFVSALKRAGLDTRETGHSYHGDRRGGQLLARAGQVVHGGDYARAVVEQHEVGVSSAARAATGGSVTTPSTRVGTAR